jgi:hypothetical protein
MVVSKVTKIGDSTGELIYESHKEAERVVRALTFFCGGAEIHYDKDDDVWVVSSRGYYHYVGA